jgi:aspartate kinase
MIVMKFGGSSVESAAAIERVAGIVRAHRHLNPAVVVSAMGKTTNRLLEMAHEAAGGRREAALGLCASLERLHETESPAGLSVAGEFAALAELLKGLSVLGELTPRSVDAISSYGERLASRIVAAWFAELGIDAIALDARDYLVTDGRHGQARPLMAETRKRPSGLPREGVPVLGGFIGATAQGVTTTLGRGGSDYSASIFGACLDAAEIQIWTDVDGMLSADPRVLPGGHRVKSISFAEAAELAYFGAKVLHPATLAPAMEKNIPVRILNSRRPAVEGTRIVAEAVPCANVLKSIACKTRITLLNIHSTRMLMAHGFLRAIFDVFERFETSVDVVATSEVSVSVTIDNTARLGPLVEALAAIAEVEVESGHAIVCAVGDGIRETRGVAGRVFRALNGVNVRMISQGASKRNLTFVVAEDDLRSAVAALHGEFFADSDPAVFEPHSVPAEACKV